jgi:hypothetical protein
MKEYSGLKNLDDIEMLPYEKVDVGDVQTPRGSRKDLTESGTINGSLVNKLHLIKLANNFPAQENGLRNSDFTKARTFLDLCKMSGEGIGAQQYDAEDFLYCKNVRYPINKLITLRRFPKPCTDNIFDKENQAEPDISRMITFFDHETNKLEDILSFSYGMKWKELSASVEAGSSTSDQSGFNGSLKKVMSIFDEKLANNRVMGADQLAYDPTHDQNQVYGPVDSIAETHIRDVGLNFEKEFELKFEYEMRSINGRTPEYAFKDIIANVLTVTMNNGKFFGGSRFWVGERPSNFAGKLDFLNPKNLDDFVTKSVTFAKSAFDSFKGGSTESKRSQLENIVKNGFALALGKMLDTIGRPSIMIMNSLLTGEPVGQWHVTIGNPHNPIISMGNLILTGTDVRFPTDELSYGDFPNKVEFIVKLKNAMPRDKAGIESMFNCGKGRIYYQPKNVKREKTTSNISKRARSFHGFGEDSTKGNSSVDQTISQVFDFVTDQITIVNSNSNADKITKEENLETKEEKFSPEKSRNAKIVEKVRKFI